MSYWKQRELPEFPLEMIEKISTDLVEKSLKVQSGEIVLMEYDYAAQPIALAFMKKALARGAWVDYRVRDAQMENLRVAKAEIPFLKQMDASLLARVQRADCFVSFGCEDTFERLAIDSYRSKLQEANRKPIREEITDEERTRRCSLYLPTHEQARIDNMSFEEYVQVYMEAISLDWEKVHEAQEILISLFDQAKELMIEADVQNPDPKKRTRVFMSLEGMTFANSTIAKNYPGSEIFSAPVLNSVQGTFYSPGRFFWKDQLIQDIYLEFRDGKIVDFDATKGKDILRSVVEFDSGSCFIGEIGIGTNGRLIADVSDSLLFEKKGASFHLAVGSPYHYRVYCKKPVFLDNGGESSVHWDVTNMLNRPGGSCMILDGKEIQVNGNFVVPGCEILNPRK